MATTPRAGPSLTGHSLPAGPNEARPRAARAGWRDARRDAASGEPAIRTSYIGLYLVRERIQAFSATLES